MIEIETLKDYCQSFYSSHYVPITIMGEEQISFSSFSRLNEILNKEITSFDFDSFPTIVNTKEIGSFGIIKINDLKCFIVVGPVFDQRPNKEQIIKYSKKLFFEKETMEQLSYNLSMITTYTYNQFINLVSFINFSLNGKLVNPLELGGFNQDVKDDIQITETIGKIDNLKQEHGTYLFEKQLFSCIKEGDIHKLNLLFEKAMSGFNYQIGTVGDSEIRQAKNVCIGLLALVGKTAAIDGGLNIEEAYDLIDLYSIECEKCSDVGQVMNLQYNAIYDFTKRIAESKKLLNYSKEVCMAIGYIKKNISKVKEVMDVVSYIGVSRTTLLTKFKKEVGENLGSYINNEKLKEAKILLKYSDKSVLEISLALGYSSQSYFQNSFKEAFGITPRAYRLGKE